MRMGVIDLFCGIGGLSHGFKAEGFDVLMGIDSDASCKYAFEKNIRARFESLDVRRLSGRPLQEAFDKAKCDVRVLVGCAPCTPFSIYTERYRQAPRTDDKWELLKEFLRLIRSVRPDVISMENVPRLRQHRIFTDFVSGLDRLGYAVRFQVVKAHHYGVAQRRTRLVLFASRWGDVQMPPATHKSRPLTVRDAIGKLPEILPGESCSDDKLHVSRALTERNLARLKATAEGGSWKDWDASMQLDCHKRPEGASFRSVYGRMRWDEPSPVITTQCLGIGNGRFGHPAQHRAISIREAALLQSFPRTFHFLAPDQPLHTTQLARQIGNAVPPRLSKFIARAIKNHLSENVR